MSVSILHMKVFHPWDIGRPQKEFVRLAEDGEISGRVSLIYTNYVVSEKECARAHPHFSGYLYSSHAGITSKPSLCERVTEMKKPYVLFGDWI